MARNAAEEEVEIWLRECRAMMEQMEREESRKIVAHLLGLIMAVHDANRENRDA